ncbi:MAG: CopG family transcriptional regulator [Clostridiales bacterium]|nr:CopG family transcriptional regulator [Clostridiales bacterium]
MGIAKGTKLKDNPKNTTFKVRLDESTAKKLEFIAEKAKLSKSEVIRKGIEIQYSQLEKE